jgi:hypothetical protein
VAAGQLRSAREARRPVLTLRPVTLDDLTIDDERSFAHVALQTRLKQALRRSWHRFLVPEVGAPISWDRALFLNLTYWGARDGADVLCENHIPADVVAHVAWHHIVARELARRSADAAAPPSAAALFFAESIASAFDLYLVGRLISNAPESDFITTQVPLMSECAQQAGQSEAAFAALMEEVSRDPERAFEDLRTLLFDAASALVRCAGHADAAVALDGFAGNRFAQLLHHYELSNWVLYARAYAGNPSGSTDAVVAGVDATLRRAPVSLDWLAEHWIDADQPSPSATPADPR